MLNLAYRYSRSFFPGVRAHLTRFGYLCLHGGNHAKHNLQNPQLVLQFLLNSSEAQRSQMEQTKTSGQTSLVQSSQSVRAQKTERCCCSFQKITKGLPWQVSCRARTIIFVGYSHLACCVAVVQYRRHPKSAMRAMKAQVIQPTFLPSENLSNTYMK